MTHFASYANAHTLMDGALTGFWAWLGLVATTTAINGVFQGKSWNLWLIDNGYLLLSLVVIGAIVAKP